MYATHSITDTGYVRFPQFLEFYANISAFDDDLKFSETMKSVWLSPSRGAPSSEANPSPSPSQNLNFGATNLSKLMSSAGVAAAAPKQQSTSANYGVSAVGNLFSEADSGVLKNITQV
jgi:hypothetical protein